MPIENFGHLAIWQNYHDLSLPVRLTNTHTIIIRIIIIINKLQYDPEIYVQYETYLKWILNHADIGIQYIAKPLLFTSTMYIVSLCEQMAEFNTTHRSQRVFTRNMRLLTRWQMASNIHYTTTQHPLQQYSTIQFMIDVCVTSNRRTHT